MCSNNLTACVTQWLPDRQPRQQEWTMYRVDRKVARAETLRRKAVRQAKTAGNVAR